MTQHPKNSRLWLFIALIASSAGALAFVAIGVVTTPRVSAVPLEDVSLTDSALGPAILIRPTPHNPLAMHHFVDVKVDYAGGIVTYTDKSVLLTIGAMSNGRHPLLVPIDSFQTKSVTVQQVLPGRIRDVCVFELADEQLSTISEYR